MIGGKTVVYTSGTFDMLHANHIHMLEYARGIGDILIVGVNTDELVAKNKSLPIVPFEERITIIRALKQPDVVIPQHSLNHKDKVEKLNFDIFVVGDDWVGRYDYLRDYGVSVVYFPYGQGVSSTNLKKKVVEKYGELRQTTDHHMPSDPEKFNQ